MGYRTMGYEGQITSWLPAAGVNEHIFGTWCRGNTATLTITPGAQNTTGFGSLITTTATTGMAEWTVSVAGIAPKATPAIGNAGTVTFSGGYVAHVKSWAYTITSAEADVTSFADGTGKYKVYKPGLLTMTGTFTCFVDSATLLKEPTLAGVAAAALVLTSQASNTVTADAIATAMTVSTPVEGVNEVTYTFQVSDPSIAFAGTTNLVPATSALALPEYDSNSDGTPDATLTFQQSAGQVWSGPAFWNSLAVNCDAQGLITTTIGIRGAGVLTPPA